ncbi:MAG: hypothetical protein ACOC85_02370 [Thermoplasmatota archaeon]
MKCPKCSTAEGVIKNGIRNTQKGPIQRYYCKNCKISFSGSKNPHTKYPQNVILYTLEQYNKGYPIKIAKKRTGRKYQYSPPISTIYSWIDRYKDVLTFLKLRKKYNIDPETVITTYRLKHRQIYPFSHHNLKLNIHSKQLPQLRRYINWIERSLDRDMFLKGPRCSNTETNHNLKAKEKDNITPRLTQLSFDSKPKGTKLSPHDIVENFFLINDSTTVCTELPVFLNPEEFNSSYSQNSDSARPNETSLNVDEPLTGHIDIVQIRYDNLYLLDYKPNLNNPENHASQLQLYKEAIHKRTSIPKDKIKTAVFNRHSYFEYL